MLQVRPTPHKMRHGYTVKELIAVVVVLLVLLALFAPALQSSRTPSRSTMCRSNLKQIGLALQNYQSIYNCLPPAGHGIDESTLRSRLDQGLAPIELVQTQSVFTYLLDILEGGTHVANYDWSRAYNDSKAKPSSLPQYPTWNTYAAKQDISVFRCTANPYINVRDPAGYGMTDYMPITYTDIDLDYDSSGIMGRRNRASTAVGCFSLSGTRANDFSDGISNTIMVAESAGRLPETSRPYMCGEFADPVCTAYTGKNDGCTKTGQRAFWRWADPTSAGGISGQRNHGFGGKAIDFVNGNKSPIYGGPSKELSSANCLAPPAEGTVPKCLWTWTNCGPNDEIFGWHNAGAFVVMADGAVRLVKLDIRPDVLRALITREENDPQPIEGGVY